MCLTNVFKCMSTSLLVMACLVTTAPRGAAAAPRVNTTTRSSQLQKHIKRMPKRIQRPRIVAASTSAAHGATAKGGNLTAARLHSTRPGTAIHSAKVRTKLDGRLRSDVHDVAKSSPKGSSMNNIAVRAGSIRQRTADQALGANSSTLAGLEKVMPGFRDRGSKGGTRLQDLAGSGGNHRNPVTTGGNLADFTGGRNGMFSEDSARFTYFKDGSSVVKVGGDGKPPTVTTTIPGTGTLVIHPDDSREYHLDNGKSLYYDSDGNKIAEVTMGAPQGGKQGGAKEPTPDDTGESSSGTPRYITGAELRGLQARIGAKGEPTGDEASSGGSIDKSKTRQGRIGQTGQPADDSPVAISVPSVDSMEFKQALRLRLRNVTPIPR